MAYTKEDFRRSTPERIMGPEDELISMVPPDKDLRTSLNTAGVEYFSDTASNGAEVWLANGSRLYIDGCADEPKGGVLEIAGPEVKSGKDVVRYQRANERTINDFLAALSLQIKKPSLRAYKRSGFAAVDDRSGEEVFYPDSLGHHQNFGTGIELPALWDTNKRSKEKAALDAFLVTKSCWAGAGLVTANGYELSQKQSAMQFEKSMASYEYGVKPAYQLRIEASLDLNVLELRLADGNMSDWVIQRDYDFTSLVLRMIEHGKFPMHLCLRENNATQSFQDASKLQPVNIHWAEQPYVQPALHQAYIAAAALEFAETQPNIPEGEVQAALDILDVCYDIHQFDSELSDVSSVADRLDWAAKLTHIRSLTNRPVTAKSMVAVRADLQWEDISPDGIAREWFASHGRQPGIPEEDIHQAQLLPPRTRAMGRVGALRCLESEGFHMITWGKVEAGKGGFARFTDEYSPDVPVHLLEQ